MPDNFLSGLIVRVYLPGGFGYVKEKETDRQHIFSVKQVQVESISGHARAVIPTAAPISIKEGMEVHVQLDNTGCVATVLRKP